MPSSDRSHRRMRSPTYRRSRDRDSDTSSRTSAMMLEEKMFDVERGASSGTLMQLNSQQSGRSNKSKVSFGGSEYSSEGGESKRTTFLSQAIARDSPPDKPDSETSNRPDRALRQENEPQKRQSSLKPASKPASRQSSRLPSRQVSRRNSLSQHTERDETSSAEPLLQWEIGNIYPVLEGRLYYCVSERNLQAQFSSEYFFFKSELAAEYRSYYKDFGPVKLSVVYRFCQLMHKMMSAKRYKEKKLVLQMQEMPEIRTNAAFLLAAYLVLQQGFSPETACAPFNGFDVEPFMNYRDATFLHPDFTISILDCVKGLKKASDRGWFNPEVFDVDDYEHQEKLENGYLSQMCDKFIAFNGPVDSNKKAQEFALPPEGYVEQFLRQNVTAVIRLNEPMYSTECFAQAGIKHYDLFFRDSTTPHEGICERFFQICTQEEGRVAVHCKTGQGRTGTLIALWYMHHHGFKAKEAIAWVRLVRPGSVIGPQQDFLVSKEGKRAPVRRNSVVMAHNIQPKMTMTQKLMRWLPFGGCRQPKVNSAAFDDSLAKQFQEAAKLRQKAMDRLEGRRRSSA